MQFHKKFALHENSVGIITIHAWDLGHAVSPERYLMFRGGQDEADAKEEEGEDEGEKIRLDLAAIFSKYTYST